MNKGITLNDWIIVISAVAVAFFTTGAGMFGDRTATCRIGGVLSIVVFAAALGYSIYKDVARIGKRRRGR